jgi:orotidine-5'-phosphate decarboxylase
MKPEIIVALDFNNLEKVQLLVSEVGDLVDFYKVGLEAFISIGPCVLEYLKNMGKKIFLDLKLHDIPNTVKKAAMAAEGYNVDIISLHIQGGTQMIADAASSLKGNISINRAKPMLVGITVLTSLNEAYLKEYKISTHSVEDYALHLAQIGKLSGLDGVVCSAFEVERIKKCLGASFVTICPGIRMPDDLVSDQKRVATPILAKNAGADYIVVGRPITDAVDKQIAAMKILEALNGQY